MKRTNCLLFTTLIFLSLMLSSCNWFLPPEIVEELHIASIITSVNCNEIYGTEQLGLMPVDSVYTEPYVAVASRMIMGQDWLLSVCVPDYSQYLMISLKNPVSTYQDIQINANDSLTVKDYYRIDLSNMKKRQNSVTRELNKHAEKDEIYVNYLVILSTNEDFNLSEIDMQVGYQGPQGFSLPSITRQDVINMTAQQRLLKVGFRPISDYSYTFSVRAPNGASVSYSYNVSTGSETFNNTQSPQASISYDSSLDVKWIDLPSNFGHYQVTCDIIIPNNGSSQYVELLMIIVSAGVLDQVVPEINIIDHGSYFVGHISVTFDYFSLLNELRVNSIHASLLDPPAAYSGTRSFTFPGMIPQPFNHHAYSNGSTEPGNCLPVDFDKYLVNFMANGSFSAKTIKIKLEIRATVPDMQALNEQCYLISPPGQAGQVIINHVGPLNWEVTLPKIGGLYKIGYKPKSDVAVSEVNILLPLSSSEISAKVDADLVLANSFVERVRREFKSANKNAEKHNLVFWKERALVWFAENKRGYYLGRPNNSQHSSTWAYNKLNTEKQVKGCTWQGIPVRSEDVSIFLLGYTMTKLLIFDYPPSQNPSELDSLLWHIKGWTDWNGHQRTKAFFELGENLARNIIDNTEVKSYIIQYFSRTEADDNEDNDPERHTRLWPNTYMPTNVYYPPNDNLPNDWDAEDSYTSPAFLDQNMPLHN